MYLCIEFKVIYHRTFYNVLTDKDLDLTNSSGIYYRKFLQKGPLQHAYVAGIEEWNKNTILKNIPNKQLEICVILI